MSKGWTRFLPFLLTLAFWLLFSLLLTYEPWPFSALGPWRAVVYGALFAVGLLVVIGVLAALTIPSDPVIEPLPAEGAPSEVQRTLEDYTEEGFEVLDPPLQVEMRPPAKLWMLRHCEAGCWGTVFRTSTVPPQVGYDVVSKIEGERGFLTSMADPKAAVLPAAPTDFRQLVPGASPGELLAHHRRAQEFLQRRGIRFEDPVRGGVAELLQRPMEEQRRRILANPLKAAVLALWRLATRGAVYRRPLEQQADTEDRLSRLRGGP